MAGTLDAAAHAERIGKLIEKKLGIRGRDLAVQLRRAGRALPRWVRRDAGIVVEAQQFAGNPKMLKRLDPTRIEQAAAAWDAGEFPDVPGDAEHIPLPDIAALHAIKAPGR